MTEQSKVYFSKIQDPNNWEPCGKSYWCPKWLQRLVVIPILRRLGFEVHDYNVTRREGRKGWR